MDNQEYTLPAINRISQEPLLYVCRNKIPEESVAAILTRNGKANIYLLGPESIISIDVEKQLVQYEKVIRIAGSNPYDNAIAFAKYKDPSTGFDRASQHLATIFPL